VIDMDTLIAPLDQINVHSFLAPDNEFMGASVTQALCNAIGGKGKIIMTQGALGHTGAQGRAKGFNRWSSSSPTSRCSTPSRPTGTSSKTARIWETLPDQVSRRSTPPSSTMTTWRSPPPTS
jgi:ribose transport system substrate-binding protein